MSDIASSNFCIGLSLDATAFAADQIEETPPFVGGMLTGHRSPEHL